MNQLLYPNQFMLRDFILQQETKRVLSSLL